MKEIKATAPTPQDWVELVRDNERLKERLELAESYLKATGMSGAYKYDLSILENKTND